ncbi:MAG: SWIM zinc finger family protein [Clostridiales bacterium]
MAYFQFPEYVPVAKRRENALKKLEKLRKKNKNISPIEVKGRKIANTWWGIEWNLNLEKYSDYSNRIGRGRSIVRNRAVIDLQISEGEIKSKVVGSGSRAYTVTISIDPLKEDVFDKLKKESMGKIDSLQELIEGKFPEEMKSIFSSKTGGLFPKPEEISLDCTCPDYANMCKHVAATLYGVSVRLDDDPKLFFVLRKIDIEELIVKTIDKKSKELIDKKTEKTSRIIEDSDLGELFKIDLN